MGSGFIAAAVVIAEALDVLLAQQVADLHLQHLQRFGLLIAQAVDGTARDDGGFPLGKVNRLCPAEHGRRPIEHHPALGAVAVALQRNAPARHEVQALYHRMGLNIQHTPRAPRALARFADAVLGIFVHNVPWKSA